MELKDIKLSAVLPVYKDKYSIPTAESIVQNAGLGDAVEAILVFDGALPEFELSKDPRIKYVFSGKNEGMRESINKAVKLARGEFIMRADCHCMFAPNFGKIMTDSCQPNWIMTAKRYFLDPEKWEVMDISPVGYEKLVIQGGIKFSGARWHSRDEERKDIDVDETMAMQGSFWLMPKAWWEKVIVNLQSEGYGPAYQDSHEMIFKTWKAGGKMMLNKNTWFAHKHRSFTRTHQEGTKENPWIRNESWKYCLDTWREYYEKEVKLKWKI